MNDLFDNLSGLWYNIYVNLIRRRNKMKKFLKTLAIVLVACVTTLSAFLLVGCGTDDDNNNKSSAGGEGGSSNPQETGKTSINITFESRYGDLSFSSKEYELVDGKVYLDVTDFPTISNEGDDKIFDKWVDSNGFEFNTYLSLKEDTTFQAVFTEPEFIWAAKWEQYEDSLSFYGGHETLVDCRFTGVSTIGVTTNIDPTKSNKAQFIKIKKSDCKEEYITKSEYEENFKNEFCFITSSNNEEKIVTENDITADVYQYNIFLLIGDWCVGYNSVGYLPKGYNLYNSPKLAMMNLFSKTALKLYCDYYQDKHESSYTKNGLSFSSLECGIDEASSKHYIVKDDVDIKNHLTIDAISQDCNDEAYTCDYDFNGDYYYAMAICNYVFSNLYDAETDTWYYSYMAKPWKEDSRTVFVYDGTSKDQYLEFKQNRLKK